MSRKFISNLNILDAYLKKLDDNKEYSRRTFLALTGSIFLSSVLVGCSATKEETKEIQDEKETEDAISINENTTAAFTALEIIKETTKELKESTEEIRNTDEMTEQVRNAVKNFDVLYKFIMGEDFDKLEENEKIDMITASMSFTEIINTVEPDYKQDISKKWAEIKEKCKDFIDEYDLYDKAVELGATIYEKGSSAWDSIKEYASDVKEEAKSR